MAQGGASAVDLVVLDSFPEAHALREVLECFGVRVNARWLGRAKELVDLLTGKEPLAEHVVLACHGDDRGILLPELHPDIAEGEPYVGAIGPEELARFVKLGGGVVICTGCSTGGREFAKAFLDGGCETYIAPEGYPEGSATLFFLLEFFYELLAKECSVNEAFERAREHDDETRTFRLYQTGGD